MIIENLDRLPLTPTPLGGKACQLVDKPELRLVNLVIGAGEEVKKHIVSVEVVFIVLAGKGRVWIEDNSSQIEKGQLLVCPPGITRSFQADQDQGLNILVIRAPNLD